MWNTQHRATDGGGSSSPSNADKYVRAILRHRFAVIALSIVAVVAAASGAPGLGFSTDYRDWFSESTPELEAFGAMQDIYAKDDNVYFMVEASNGESMLTPRHLAAVEELTTAAWRAPFVTRVESLINYQHVVGDGDELLVSDLVRSPADLTEASLGIVRDVALAEPELVRRLVSPMGDALGVNVTLELPGESMSEIPEVATFARDLARDFEARHPELRVHLTGMVMMNNAFPEASQQDMGTLTLAMYAVVFLLMLVLTGSLSGSLASLVVLFGSIAVALGAGGFFSVGLTPVSAVAPTIITTLAVADCLHILIGFRDALARGVSKLEAAATATTSNLAPVVITSVTTAAGLFSLNFSDAPPYRHYGNMAGVGVVVACVLSVTLFPALLSMLPARAPKRTRSAGLPPRFVSFVLGRRRSLLLGVMAVSFAAALAVPRLALTDNFVEYFDSSVQFRSDTDHVSSRMSGFYTLSYDLRSLHPSGIADPGYLAKVEAFVGFLRAQPEVQHVASITDVMKRLNRSMHGDDTREYRLPEDAALASQYLLLYEMALPYGLDLNAILNLDKTATKVTATVRNVPSSDMRRLEDVTNAWLAEQGAGVLEGRAASASVMFAHIIHRNIDAMLWGLLLALLFITGVLWVAFRSLRFSLLSLVPNVLPIITAFGVWALAVGEMGMAVATVASIALGIVVDDTVHFMNKYLHGRRDLGLAPEAAAELALSSVGKAIWATSVCLMLGFGALMFSTFKANWTMGAMSALTIALALVFDLLMLPGLLVSCDRFLGVARVTPQRAPSPGGGDEELQLSEQPG